MADEILYQTSRIFSAPIFRTKYNPTIVGKENIPVEGAVIFSGNHMNQLDIQAVMASTKRTIHWALSSSEIASNKVSGMILVDKDKSEDEMLSCLARGSSIGIFAEGKKNILTDQKMIELINMKNANISLEDFKELIDKKTLLSQIDYLERLYQEGRISLSQFKSSVIRAKQALLEFKEEGIITSDEYDDSLILPFDLETVTLASKSGATIIPFAVNGDYDKLNNNLTVRFDKGFKVDQYESLEEANVYLRETVKKMVKENIRIKF